MSAQQTTFSQRSFLLKIYMASIAVIGFYLALSPLLKPAPVRIALLSSLGIAFLIGYVVTVRSGEFIRSSHYYIICSYGILLATISLNGGITAPGVLWFLLCPLIAFIMLSTRVARFWLVVILVTVSLFYIFDETLTVPALQNRETWCLVSYLLFFPMVYSIMRIFRREVSKKNVELNALNQSLRQERETLQKTQQEILLQSERIREAEKRALVRSAKLSFYLDQLIEVKRMEEVHSGNLEYSLRAILQFLHKAMELENVVLWHSPDPGMPLAMLRYLGDENDVYERAVLRREDFADAYDMLQTGAIISACDPIREAQQLKHLFQFSAGKDSMINCPYFLDGKFAGFISCRASGKTWSAEDVIFVRAISDTVSLAFKSHFRIVQQQLLEEKQREITVINESLERKVAERTVELNRRNKQLTDFSFTNAHHIRGPICRLLGLQNLLNATDDCQEVLKIARYMSVSVDELDSITRETSEKLNVFAEEVSP